MSETSIGNSLIINDLIYKLFSFGLSTKCFKKLGHWLRLDLRYEKRRKKKERNTHTFFNMTFERPLIFAMLKYTFDGCESRPNLQHLSGFFFVFVCCLYHCAALFTDRSKTQVWMAVVRSSFSVT